MYWLGESQPSPEKVAAFAKSRPLAGKPEAERTQIVNAVGNEYRRLDFDQSRALLATPELKEWWHELNLAERRTFRMLLFPKILQVVQFFDKLPPHERKRSIDRIIGMARNRAGGGEQVLPGIDQRIIGTVAITGLKPFIEGSLLDQNFDMLLMFHEMERRFVWRR